MTVTEIREAIFKRRPNFKKVMDTWGDKTLLNYFTQDFKNLGTPSEDFLEALTVETEVLFGEKIAQAAAATMREKRWVNTTDHHGLLCHPYFYTTALARSHESVRKSDAVTVTLPFSSISYSNDSFPRGFFFHDQHGEVQKIFFKSLRYRRMPVYALPALTQKEFLHAVRNIHLCALETSAHKRLLSFIQALKEDERIWNQDSYASQLTLMNAILWRTLFGDERGDFVYLPIENVATRLLLEKHLIQKTPLYNALFLKEWRDTFVLDMYRKDTDYVGTEFFWYIDYEKEKSRPLVVENGSLVTREKDVVIPLTPESIRNGLENKTLMPGNALMMVLLQGEEGVACGGGPNQLECLDEYMRDWDALCTKHDIKTHIPNTQILSGATALFHTKNEQGHTEPATLFDILLYETEPFEEQIDTTLAQTKILDAFITVAPIYEYMYTKVKNPITEEMKTTYLAHN